MTPIRTLILEDSPESVVILIEQLRRAGFDPSVERVESPEAFAAALDQHPWDIVFSDHALGQFNSIDALHMVRERGLNMPFIVVSGALDEEVQTSVLKAGVNDFIPKGQTARLSLVVERELQGVKDRAEHQRVTKALGRAEARFRLFFEQAPVAYQALNEGGFVADVNPAWLALLGYDRREVIGRWWGSLLPADQSEAFRRQLPELNRSAVIAQSEYSLKAKHNRWLKVSASGRGAGAEPGADEQTFWLLSPCADLLRHRQPDADEAKPAPGTLLPICMYCKKIRGGDGRWLGVETFFEHQTSFHFSHGICPDCVTKVFSDLDL